MGVKTFNTHAKHLMAANTDRNAHKLLKDTVAYSIIGNVMFKEGLHRAYKRECKKVMIP